MRRTAGRGFSFPEAVVCIALLGMLVLCLFAVVNFGFQAFGLGNSRMGVLAEFEGLAAMLRRDIECSTYSSIKIKDDSSRTVSVSTSSGTHQETRHLLCMVGMSEWGRPEAFATQDGEPIWNRYWLYHADLAVPQGSLYRLEIEPDNVGANRGGGWLPWQEYLTDHPTTPPANGPLYTSQLIRSRRLTSKLLGFDATRTPLDVIVKLRILWAGRKGPDGGKRTEVQELSIRVPPRNRMR